jgi:hypothetical protein
VKLSTIVFVVIIFITNVSLERNLETCILKFATIGYYDWAVGVCEAYSKANNFIIVDPICNKYVSSESNLNL